MRLIPVILAVLTAGCSGPFMWLPGGQLAGAEAPLDPATIPHDAAVLQLETNAGQPYSVNVGFRVIDGQIYIDPAAERRWYQHIQADPRVRIRFAGADAIHPALAQTVSDPAIVEQFEADRIILRLAPRS